MERVRPIYTWRFLATVSRLIAAQFQKPREREAKNLALRAVCLLLIRQSFLGDPLKLELTSPC